MMERRADVRKPLYGTGRVADRYSNLWSPYAWTPIHMADISLGGLAFTIDRMPEDELLADTHRTIEFHVPNRERRIRLLAKIVYANRISSSASLRIGVAFVKVSEMDLASIARYMALSDENFHCAGAGR